MKEQNCQGWSTDSPVHFGRSNTQSQKSRGKVWTEHPHCTEKWPHTEIHLDTVQLWSLRNALTSGDAWPAK